MEPKNIWGHFKTITKHKMVVMYNCFRVGLYKQGLLHDLSKYGPAEFIPGVMYYQGNRSPNAAEREIHGVSRAWLHHKGRNKHHYEYWIDFTTDPADGLVGHRMPLRFVVEMMMDRIAACKIYKGRDYTNSAPWEYYIRTRDYIVIHKDTQMLLERLLIMLRDEGEHRTFAYMKKLLMKGS